MCTATYPLTVGSELKVINTLKTESLWSKKLDLFICNSVAEFTFLW